jgi:predicted acylesterase/phospholipase RssA
LSGGVLPQAVEIDGEYFWDGGYMGNPALFPLIYGWRSRDIIVIHVNPTERLEIRRRRRRSSIASTDQLQFVAVSRDARDRIRHQVDRRGRSPTAASNAS